MQVTIARLCGAALRMLDRWTDIGPLFVRIAFGYFWFETGLAKVENLDGFASRFVAWGIPLPHFNAALSAWTEMIGGALIFLGLFTRLTAVPMIINMIVAIALVVIKSVGSIDDFVELDEVVYILIFFWLLMAGPGRYSLDHLLARALGVERLPSGR
jgi:putative oxidoreductase